MTAADRRARDRAVRRLALGLVLVVSCQSGGAGTATTGAPAPTAVTSPSTVSPTAAPQVDPAGGVETTPPPVTDPGVVTTLRLSPREALAVDGDVRLVGTWDAGDRSGAVRFGPGTHTVDVTLRQPATFTFAYPGGDVTWAQEVTPGAVVDIAQPWRRTNPPAPAGDLAVVWLALGDTASYLAQLDAAPGANVASPVCWFVSSEGGLSNGCDARFVAAAQDRGFAVWPAVAGLDADANHLAFSDPAQRSAHAATLSEWGRELGADGINLDIEGYREEDAAAFAAFVAELVPLVHEWGGTVSYDLIPRTDAWDVGPPELAFWSTAPPRRQLVDLVDYTVLMSYDQFNRFRPAGPVASPAWVEDTLTYLLRYADPEDVILGVPFYGRIWDPNELERPRAVGIASLANLAQTAETAFDETHGLERATLADGRYFWVETPDGLNHRLDVVAEHGLAGWAAWRLGFDAPAMWDAIAR